MVDHQMTHAAEIADYTILDKIVQAAQDTSCRAIGDTVGKPPHPAMYPALLAAGGGK